MRLGQAAAGCVASDGVDIEVDDVASHYGVDADAVDCGDEADRHDVEVCAAEAGKAHPDHHVILMGHLPFKE